LLEVFQIVDFVREKPLFVKKWLVEPLITEMALDSIAEVVAPGQAARQ
jgi:hypothetical protein